MEQIIIKDIDVNNIKDVNDESFILFYYDSFGSISNLKDLKNIMKEKDILDIEIKIKNKIKSYNFKTLQKRNYLPIGTSIYINHNNKNILYTPIMWVNQDISNTNNIYYAIKASLLHIFKIKFMRMNSNKNYLYIHRINLFSGFDNVQINNAINDVQKYLNTEKNYFIQSFEYKDDINIYSGDFNINEQSPIYQNNEFRELTYT